MQHFASKLLHEDGGRYQRASCTRSGRRSRRQMVSTKATTLNSEQNVIKVLLLSLHLLAAVHLTQHKLPATLFVAHAHLPLALVVLLLLARRVVPVDRGQHRSCRHHCNHRRSLTEIEVETNRPETTNRRPSGAVSIEIEGGCYRLGKCGFCRVRLLM